MTRKEMFFEKRQEDYYGPFHQYIINTVFGLRQRQNKTSDNKQIMGYRRKNKLCSRESKNVKVAPFC
jgi:hypothetical protein